MSLLQRVRDNGRGPPSLLADERNVGDVAFDALMVRILDLSAPNSISLGSESKQVAADFQQVLESCKSIDSIPGDLDSTKKVAALEQRRCVVLAIIAATPPNNESLKIILSNGLLISVRPWLDDILNSTVGGVDLLLHFLTSITALPVTKTHIRDSGMGKKVGSIEKLKICAGTPNESAIKARIQAVKDAWNSSVKALKDQEGSPNGKKRTLELTESIAKKPRTDDAKKSFSSLLKKVSPGGKPKALAKTPFSVKALIAPTMPGSTQANKTSKPELAAVPKTKKSTKRVKWSDHFGGNLEHSREIEGNRGEQPVNPDEAGGAVSWTNRLKRDRLREKELLSQAKKKKLLDDDDDDIFAPAQRMTAKVGWRPPQLLPERTDVTKTPADSKEIITQLGRMASVAPVRYVSEHLVPKSPSQLSDVESALDIQSAQSSAPTTIPFFVPQLTPTPTPAPAPVPVPIPMIAPAPVPYANTYAPPPPPPPAMSVGATADMVQSMGLPLFLVGSNVQALQTVASNPSLLNTFVDAHGMYDQPNLMALVQTLGQSMPNQPPPQQQPAYGNSYPPQPVQHSYGNSHASPYGPAGGAAPPPVPGYGQPSGSHYGPSTTPAPVSRGFRSDQNTEANLHMAGYGPTTTQAEIIALFSPYVRVKEVVMKNGFCFVNTNDPIGSQAAKDALSGALVGGMPIRINMAQRRSRDAAPPAPSASIYGGGGGGGGGPAPPHMLGSMGPPPPGVPPPGVPPPGPPRNVDSVRDDRGNPATKNLFVAGYGPGTSESQLRDIFNQHAQITGCVMKGNFSFVNTCERSAAVQARQALMGSMVNGGVLRINFAKETGRLGTSFDLTYNSTSGGPGGPPPGGGGGGGGGGGPRSYYGR